MYLGCMRRAIIFCVGLGLLLGAFFVYKHFVRPVYLSSQVVQSEEFQKLLTYWETMPPVLDEIILIGNSLCVEYPWEQLDSSHVTKMAMRGDVSLQLCDRLHAIEKREPRAVMVSMGINDIFNENEFDESMYRQFVKSHQQRFDHLLILMSLSPVSFESGLFSDCKRANEQIQVANTLIKAIADEHGAIYLDVHTALTEDGKLAEKYTYDGIHLTEEGYRIWEFKFNSLSE